MRINKRLQDIIEQMSGFLDFIVIILGFGDFVSEWHK